MAGRRTSGARRERASGDGPPGFEAIRMVPAHRFARGTRESAQPARPASWRGPTFPETV